jgi:hypothetical protein
MSKYRKYTFEENIFLEVNTPEKAYWLGFLMGDGNINQKSTALYLEISNKDLDHLEKFKKFLKSNSPIKPTRKECSRILVCSKKFVASLKELGVTTRKTFKTKTPNIAEELISDFYRGILDSDGWIVEHAAKNRKKLQHEFGFSSACKTFLMEIQKWIQIKIGKKCGYLVQRIKNKQKVWQLIIGGNKNFVKIANIIYNSEHFLNRKHATLTKYLKIIS